MTRIAVLTSGGDAPGMNAAVRAAVRTGVNRGWEMFGVKHGFSGLMAGDFLPLGPRNVGGIIGQAGTMLASSRSPEFESMESQRRAVLAMESRDIEGLIVIGGNGSQKGAFALYERGFPVVGIASTIDNDIPGVDITIGVDTALNVALEAIDRLPELLRYVPGSARRDGRKLPDPVISNDGRTLRFAIGAMSAGDTVVLRFAAVVGPTAEQGEAINHASAIGIDDSLVSYRSNEASAAIGIVPGPFRREAHLIGRVFIDDNGDGLPGVDEPGVPGVLVALEDGTGSVTDITGRWHIEAVRPGLHALRLDPALASR